VTDDGVEIAFDDAGEGVPVIWLHGITDDRTSWGPVTSRLTDKMRCIRVDLRGHGRSANKGPYAAGFVSDLAAVIRATGARSPVVVGHSLGGVVATLAASMGLTGPVLCVDQPLRLGSFTELVPDAVRTPDPAPYGGPPIAAQPEPGLYIAGMKSYGRAPTFLMITGYEQVRSIVADIAGDREAAQRVELVLPETGVCSGPGPATAKQECCGGSPSNTDAGCCRADETTKAEGKSGCGCG